MQPYRYIEHVFPVSYWKDTGDKVASRLIIIDVIPMTQICSKLIVIPLAFIMLFVSAVVPAAEAAVIETEVIFNQQSAIGKADLTKILAREDVRRELLALGVDPEYVDQRLAALSPTELSQLQQKIDELPAGASALAIIGVLFIVLLLLEVLGVTNIFNKL